MRLEEAAGEPGHWINQDWQPGTPGTFAVIAGVSRYKHLRGGAGPVPTETYDLPQLFVSAKTAHAFFTWLRDEYRQPECPLAECWLLLSPTDEERAAGLTSHAVPSFDTLAAALGSWHSRLRNPNDPSLAQSRSIFFFSGHGVEITQTQQFLLPSDYLKPPLGSDGVNFVVDTQNLWQALSRLPVRDQFFFFDACRNGHPKMRELENFTGTALFALSRARKVNAKRNAPLFYASESGAQAFQPRDALTIFGQAVLDGLRGQSPLALECDPAACRISISELEEFLNKRIPALLTAAGEDPELQTPSQPGHVRERRRVVAEVPPPVVAAPPSTFGADFAIRARTMAIPEGLLNSTNRLPALEGIPTAAITPIVDATSAPIAGGPSSFGSESVTAMWSSLRIHDLSDPGVIFGQQDALVHSLVRIGESRSFRIVFSVPVLGARAGWLRLDLDQSLAVALPGDASGDVRYLLEIDAGPVELAPSLTQVRAGLALDNVGQLGTAAELWTRYQSFSAADAVSQLDPSALQDLLFSKAASPLAATVAGILLLKAARYDLLHDWLGNLARMFPDRPDGAVLWAQQLETQPGRRTSARDVVDALTPAHGRLLPHTGDALGLAAALVATLDGSRQLDAARRERVALLRGAMAKALRFYRPGGLFTVFIGPPEALGPDLNAWAGG